MCDSLRLTLAIAIIGLVVCVGIWALFDKKDKGGESD